MRSSAQTIQKMRKGRMLPMDSTVRAVSRPERQHKFLAANLHLSHFFDESGNIFRGLTYARFHPAGA